MKITKLLVVNRGEIACRVMRTASRLGIKTVAVYSEADRKALHVRLADESVCIGPPSPSESYLNIENIIQAATTCGCDAVHPGYGFLSENTDFAAACEEASLIFIGPSSHAIELMGDKAKSKRAMIEAGVPCIPGYQGEDQDPDTLVSEAASVGYPLMIKAAAGGGGRGMRLVHTESQLMDSLEAARSEAINAFGSGDLILEKAVIRPRHVEVQVFADQHGNVIYLGERDCSVQRRHQKVIEEAPCPVMTADLREKMGKAAVKAAQSVDYVGAGTVEFLLADNEQFYFLEMNTRLQVEHPVTELITGLDLVEMQIRVAEGTPLLLDQADVELNGHAIEVRLYAEDPANDFLPSTGLITAWSPPTGNNIRLDAGVEQGDEVSPYYDPMIAKVIAYGASREEARHRLTEALSGSLLVGPATNRDFLIDSLQSTTFASGEATTAFIEDEYGETGFSREPTNKDFCFAALAQFLTENLLARKNSLNVSPELLNWTNSAQLASVFIYKILDKEKTIVVKPQGADEYLIGLNDEDPVNVSIVSFDAKRMQLVTEGKLLSFQVHRASNENKLTLASDSTQLIVEDVAGMSAAESSIGDGVIKAPMHGQLLEVLVSEGDDVAKGQRLAVLEAMKMQHEIVSETAGVVATVHAQPGSHVAMNTLILEIDSQD